VLSDHPCLANFGYQHLSTGTFLHLTPASVI
jgi:hypothetical protein